MASFRSLRWRLRTWLNRNYWNSPVAIIPRPISSRIIVGITTSPQRIKNLEPVLRSILRQSCPPDEIHLNIPHIYKRNTTPYIIPSNLKNIDSKIKFVRTEDIGPATKIVPVLLGLDQSSDTLVITADDDILMLPNAIEVIAEAFSKDSSAVYGLSGYRLNPDFTPLHNNHKTAVDILEGYAHFAVHRKFVGDDFMAYLKITHSVPAGFLHDDAVLANYFALRKIARFQLFDPRANRKLMRKRGAQLYYGIDSDALHKGGGDCPSNDSAQQTRQLKDLAHHLKPHKLWNLPN
jgi:hypothetical protein